MSDLNSRVEELERLVGLLLEHAHRSDRGQLNYCGGPHAVNVIRNDKFVDLAAED